MLIFTTSTFCAIGSIDLVLRSKMGGEIRQVQVSSSESEVQRLTSKKKSKRFLLKSQIKSELKSPRSPHRSRVDYIMERLRRGALQLDRCKHAKIVSVLNPLIEGNDTLAMATEPVLGSLANITGYLEDRLRQGVPSSLREHTFHDFEVKYGLLQVSFRSKLSIFFCLARHAIRYQGTHPSNQIGHLVEVLNLSIWVLKRLKKSWRGRRKA